MDSLCSAHLKGKGIFTVFCTSHYRMYWHTPYWVLGVCVWAWGFAIGVGGFHYWDIQENWDQPPLKCWLSPPTPRQVENSSPQSSSKLVLWGWSPHPLLPWQQQDSVGLQQNQHYIVIASQITGFWWTHPFKPQERSGLVLVWRSNRRCCGWFYLQLSFVQLGGPRPMGTVTARYSSDYVA